LHQFIIYALKTAQNQLNFSKIFLFGEGTRPLPGPLPLKGKNAYIFKGAVGALELNKLIYKFYYIIVILFNYEATETII
jgi:hypothetical protein